MSEVPHKEFLLHALRAASLRAKMFSSEFDAVGVLLKSDAVTPEQALVMVKEFEGLSWISAMTEAVMKDKN